MDTAGYIVLSRQAALFRQMDIIANNIANANTNGYRSESVLFSEFLAGEKENQTSFTSDVAVSRNLEGGPLRHTGRSLDAAIDGTGYFVVDTPLGERYTRVGSFSLDAEGNVVTPQGYALQGAGGPITFDPADQEIIIREDGTLSAINAQGQQEDRGTLRIVKFENERMLKKYPNGLYGGDSLTPENALVKEDFIVAQGMVEGSNVNATGELTRMIKVSRSVGSTSNFMRDLHELQRRAVNTIARQQ